MTRRGSKSPQNIRTKGYHPLWQTGAWLGGAGSLLGASWGLFNSYIPLLHDITAYIWGRAVFEVMRSGWWYPEWLPQLWFGFGLPVFHYYAPLYYWLLGGLQLIGLDVILSSKVIVGIGLLLGWSGVWLWVRQFAGKPVAFFSASLFIWAPYYLSLVYLRGAFPEFLALSILPWLFWAITRAFKLANRVNILAVMGVLAVLFITHTLTSGMAIGLGTLYVAYLYLFESRNKSIIVNWLVGLLGATALTAFYWLPMLSDLHLISSDIWVSERFAFFTNFPDLIDLINPRSNRDLGWLSLGIAHSIILVLALLGYREILNRRAARQTLIAGGVALFLVLLALPYSDWLWRLIPGLPYLQFPTRLLGPAILLIAVAAGILLENMFKHTRDQWIALVVTVGLVIAVYLPFTRTEPYLAEETKQLSAEDFSVYRYVNKTLFVLNQEENEEGITYFDRGIFSYEYLPRQIEIEKARQLASITMSEANHKFNQGLSPQFAKVEVREGVASIRPVREGLVDFEYQIAASQPSRLRINQWEFPNWQIWLDGQTANIEIVEDEPGQFLNVPVGSHTLTLKWQTSTLTRWSRYFSLAALLLLVAWGYGLGNFRKKKSAKLGRYDKNHPHKKSR
ncbi:TPA: hypothetical protein DHW58_00190 [Patescibacteria group bacterium]|nr:hypothetical protein [Patescibacteria group bacterium]